MNPIIVEDTTLRDGEQAPGVALSGKQKLQILIALDLAGVPMVEVGTASMGGQERKFIERAATTPLRTRLVGWNRANLEDLKISTASGLKCVHIGSPTSDIQIRSGVGTERASLYNHVCSLVSWAKTSGLFVSVSAEDASRSEVKTVIEYAKLVKEAGADRLRISDTLGLFTPFAYYDLIKAVREEAGIDIQIHVHNDLGLAMGNVVSGVEAGAKYVHATVNGWSERVGHPSLELVAVALKRLYGIETGIDLAQLPALCRLVSSCFRRAIPPWQPVVGADVFTHESGIHASGTLRDATAFEPFPPAWVGQQHKLIAGKHSGSHGIQYLLAQGGMTIERSEAIAFLPSVREEAIERGQALSIVELSKLYAQWKNKLGQN